ncbi:methyltransferase [Taibaiella sp. KBW10]|uniref:O-methyltransferase n=1 Tax=Taibaiella sp. KBW10 TaxID=2153357 RepID=UPI000F5A93D6|nr:class I SAM-dependent methyltransferase [Taibaiella sp. KBW10]RQO32509.1 methyltransferase [Taibaiella sp. KBW10]
MEQHQITSQAINEYAEQYSQEESGVLKSLNEATLANVRGAQMLSGALQGSFLSIISKLIKPKHILELGTYTGYSAICLAQGLAEGGTLHTIDTDDSLQQMRQAYWKEAGLEQIIVQHIGAAAEVLPKIDVSFDLVFIDADKKNYGLYFDMLIDTLPLGACLIADNVLFHSEVVLAEAEQSKSAQSMHAFNEKIKASDRVEQVILPIRDGISLIRKIK